MAPGGMKLVCRPYVRTWGLSEAMYCIEEGTCDIVGTFFDPRSHFAPPPRCGAPVVIQRTGNCASLAPPSLRPCIRYIKSDKLRQTNCNEFLENFVMKKAGRIFFYLFTVLCSTLLDSIIVAFYFYTYFNNDSISEIWISPVATVGIDELSQWRS